MMLRSLLKDRGGATAIEYSLIAAFIAIVIITSVRAIGVSLDGVFNDVVAGFTG